jgi:3-oxoadipate enol-lactonase
VKVKVNGVEIAYRIEGREGAPWLTFSNSLATDMGMWDDQVAALEDDFRILRYDKRGHGESATPARGDIPIETLVADLIALWDALGIRKSHFVGLSIGGMTGFGLGLDHPDRVASLTLACTRADSPPEYNAAWPARVAVAEKDGMAALVGSTLERWFTQGCRDRDKPAMEKMARMIANTSVAGYCGCAWALQNLPYLDRLGEIRMPTLMLGGSNDILRDGTRDAYRRIPGALYFEVGPAGHIANVEQPALFTAGLKTFLARQAA